MKSASLATALSIVLCLPGPGLATGEIPRPDLVRADPSVRQQLEQMREQLDVLLEQGEVGRDLYGALGLMGELYLAYDYRESAAACFERVSELQPLAFRPLYLAGFLEDEAGESEQAIALLERALDLQPADAPTLLRLGRLQHELARPTVAAQLFRRALEADPSCAAASYGLAEVARAAGDLDEAVLRYRQALEVQPELDQAKYGLGLTLRDLGRIDEAREILRGVEVGATGGDTAWSGCQDQVLSSIRALASGASVHLMRAALANRNGDIEAELREYRLAIQANQQDPVARKRFAATLVRADEIEQAIAEYQEAIRLAPGDAVARYDLAEVLRFQGDLDRASALYLQAMELDPRFARPHHRLASIAFAEQRFAEAVPLFRQAIALGYRGHDARTPLAVSLVRLGERDEGVELLSSVLRDLAQSDPGQQLEIAEMLLLLGGVEAARPTLERLANGDAEAALQARAFMWIGSIELGRGSTREGRRYLEQALALDPTLEQAKAFLDSANQP